MEENFHARCDLVPGEFGVAITPKCQKGSKTASNLSFHHAGLDQDILNLAAAFLVNGVRRTAGMAAGKTLDLNGCLE